MSRISNPLTPEDKYAAVRARLAEDAAAVDSALAGYLAKRDERCAALFDAMSYSVSAGGKRIRPFLALEFCRLNGGRPEDALPFACAVELIHTYSLIHDDLPCMDDDALRRGKPTNHKVFGEATALLAGDALLTLAFEAAAGAKLSPERVVSAVGILSRGAGAAGMCGGQQLDLEAEEIPPGLGLLKYTQLLKTGRLIEAACLIGVAAAGLPAWDAAYRRASDYALGVGEAFQIIDDILDATVSEEALGKSASDVKNGKATFLTYMTKEEAFVCAAQLTEKAVKSLGDGDEARLLADFAEYLLVRVK